jgi:hypothetical protein
MSRAAFSVCVAALYIIGLGCGLVFVPNVILSLFRLPLTDEVWIHMLGMITFFLGITQYYVARTDLRSYLKLTVILRYCVVLFVVGFILVGLAQPMFILIALVDVLGATWTLWELRRQVPSTMHQPEPTS